MMKKYFTDGLIQVAIVLSLLRTDLYNYLNTLADYGNSDIEMILGTSFAYTQTHFHRRRVEALSTGYASLKGPAADFSPAADFEYLFSLAPQRNAFIGAGRDLDAWLVSRPQPVELASEGAMGNTPATGDNEAGEDSPDTRVGGAVAGAGAEGNAAPRSEEEPMAASSDDEPAAKANVGAADPTKEDMDLIEVLWRQDIDLGVGRDVFDVSLRKELERDCELELHKQRRVQEEADRVLEQKESEEKERLSDVNYIVDNETGELVPAPPGYVPVQQQQRQAVAPSVVNSPPLLQNEGFSIEEAMRMFDGPLAPPLDQQPNYSIPGAELDREIEQLMQQQQQQLAAGATSPPGEVAPHGGATQQRPPTQQLIVVAPVPLRPQPGQFEENAFARQSSFEQRWQDVESVMLDDVHVDSDMDVGSPTAVSAALLHNVSLCGDNFSADSNLTRPLEFPQQFGMVAPPGGLSANLTTNLTGSLGALPSTTFLDMDTRDLVYSNMSTPASPLLSPSAWPIGGATGVDNASSVLFQNLLDSPLLDQLDMVNASSALPPASSGSMMKMVEDASSDSAFSSFGDASPLPDYLDSASDMSSPYDCLEGATGGDGSDGDTKPKCESYDGGYAASCNYSGNATGGGAEGGEAHPGAVRHNHTYTTAPGSTPREVKCYKDRGAARAKAAAAGGGGGKLALSPAEIVDCPVERFTALLSSRRLTRDQAQEARDMRRRGKNKVAAQNCRQRKMHAVGELATEVDKLRAVKQRLTAQRAAVRAAAAVAAQRLARLHDAALGALRDAAGRPYDAATYALQQAPDGDVYVVPRAASTLAPTGDGARRERAAKPQKAARKD